MQRNTRIVARTNGVGMDRDVRILRGAVATFASTPAFSRYRSISPLHSIFSRRSAPETVIFLERITRRWLRQEDRFVLIPNQERFPERQLALLGQIDHIFCKSVHAQQIFSAHHPSCHYLGFTSIDRRLESVPVDYSRFFHLAGGSALKGTEVLVDLWRRHPEWPLLTIVWHRDRTSLGRIPQNVHVISDYMPDAELQALQRTCGVHLCPSLSEGWGHYIVEGMSCEAVVLVTDGPPMNELVDDTRGVVVPASRSEPRKMGFNFHVDPVALEAKISELVAMPDARKQQLGRAARAWYDVNHAAFLQRLQMLWKLVDA